MVISTKSTTTPPASCYATSKRHIRPGKPGAIFGYSGKSVFTVEHILPKTESLTAGWISMLANGDSERAAAIREQWAHRLGNLTLSGYNANLGKMDFQRKRDRKNENGDFIGYRNGLYLNRELATRDDWTEQAIRDRTTALCEEVRTLFALDGPT